MKISMRRWVCMLKSAKCAKGSGTGSIRKCPSTQWTQTSLETSPHSSFLSTCNSLLKVSTKTQVSQLGAYSLNRLVISGQDPFVQPARSLTGKSWTITIYCKHYYLEYVARQRNIQIIDFSHHICL